MQFHLTSLPRGATVCWPKAPVVIRFANSALRADKKKYSFLLPYPSTISDGPVGIPAPSISEKGFPNSEGMRYAESP